MSLGTLVFKEIAHVHPTRQSKHRSTNKADDDLSLYFYGEQIFQYFFFVKVILMT